MSTSNGTKPEGKMSDFNTGTETEEMDWTLKKWIQIRKEEALRIDTETAEVAWNYGDTIDPYGVCTDLPAEYQQTGRLYFARSPESDIWVYFGDLCADTIDRLWEIHKEDLAFNWRNCYPALGN